MNLRRSVAHSGYTEDAETDSTGAIQSMSLAFRTFNQGLDEFGNSLVASEPGSLSSRADSRQSRRGSVWSESTEENCQSEGGIALREYVCLVCTISNSADRFSGCDEV